jgi:hypothetical protein
MESTFAWSLTKPIMGDKKNGYNGTMHYAIEFINKM